LPDSYYQQIMETDAHTGFLEILKEHTPDPGGPLSTARQEFSAFYTEYQQGAGEPPFLEKVAIDNGNLYGYWISAPGSRPDRIVLFFHGGGFMEGSTADHTGLILRLAKAAEARVFSVDYRLAPEHPFPAAVHDAVSAYRWLLARGYPHHRIVPAGISAGGTLVLSLLVSLRDGRLPLPPAAVCMSPATDLSFPGKSVQQNRETDWITPERLASIRAAYLAGHDESDPLASPVHADLRGFPRLLVQAAMHELLFDDIIAFVDKARWAGVPTRFEVWQEMFHCWQVFADRIPEGQEAIDHAGAFIRDTLIR
jgi:acetyl esterase/lipase